MMTIRFGLLFLITLVMAPGCATQSAVNDDAYFRDLVANAYAKPFSQGDTELWLSAFAEDAVAMHNRRPVDTGKPAIREFGEAVARYFRIEQFDVTVTQVRRSGDWALTRGEYVSRFVNKSDGQAPWGQESGKFILLWQRQANDEWKIILDMGNSNGEPAAAH